MRFGSGGGGKKLGSRTKKMKKADDTADSSDSSDTSDSGDASMDDSSDSSDDSSLDDSSDSSDDSDDSQSYDDYGPDGAQDDNLDDEIEDTQTEGTGGYKSASSGGKSANKNRVKGLNRPGAKSGDMTKKVTKAGEGGAGGMTLAERRERIPLRRQMAELRYEPYVAGGSATLLA